MTGKASPHTGKLISLNDYCSSVIEMNFHPNATAAMKNKCMLEKQQDECNHKQRADATYYSKYKISEKR